MFHATWSAPFSFHFHKRSDDQQFTKDLPPSLFSFAAHQQVSLEGNISNKWNIRKTLLLYLTLQGLGAQPINVLTKTKKELRSIPPAAPALTDTGVWGASALSRAPPANPPITLRRMFERFPDKINQISHKQPATSCLDSTFQETSKSTAAPTRLTNEPPPAPLTDVELPTYWTWSSRWAWTLTCTSRWTWTWTWTSRRTWTLTWCWWATGCGSARG